MLIPLVILVGFGKRSVGLVNNAIKRKKLCVVYSHTKTFAKQKEDFINFIKYIKKMEEENKLEIIRPCDLIKDE